MFSDISWLVPPVSERSETGFSHWYVYRGVLTATGSEDCLINIAVDSKYWLYVNGQLVVREGGLKRGPVPEGTYYDEVDISRHVSEGETRIAVLLWHFRRNGFSHRDSGMPGLVASCMGGKLHDWKVKKHPAYFDAGFVRDGYRLSESSVGFDARLAHDEWLDPDFNDSEWSEPIPNGKAGDLPWGQLEKRPIPQWSWNEPKEYESVDVKEEGVGYMVYRCNLPYNLFFTPSLEVDQESWKSAAGSSIDIIPALVSNCLKTVFIAREGHQTFESPAWLSGDQVVYRIPKDIAVKKLTYRETSYPAELMHPFACDDTSLTRFSQMAQRTLMLTMRDNFMDCPCRERAQWPGDFVIQHAQLPYSMEPEGFMLARKAFREFFRWQRQDGVIYGPVPEGNWKMELPAQMLALVSAYGPWLYYMHTGDLDLLKEIYPAAKKYVDLWQLDDRGLLQYRPDKAAIPDSENSDVVGGWDWLDWGERIDKDPLLNMWYICALEGTRKMAECVGNTSEASDLELRASLLKDAVNAAFWQKKAGAYASGLWTHDPDDRVQAMAVLSGVATANRQPSLVDWLSRVHQASPYMEKYVLEALFDLGVGEIAIKRLKDRYQVMLDSGTSSLWEFFHDDPEGTLNHSWSGGPSVLLAEKVAGLFPLQPGWKCFEFRPNPCGLRNFLINVATPLGLVGVLARFSVNGWKINLTVPTGAVAKVDLSAIGGGSCQRESGDWEFTVSSHVMSAVKAN